MRIQGAGTWWSAAAVRKGSGAQEVLTTCPDPATPAQTVKRLEKTGLEPGVPLAPSQPSLGPGAYSPNGETKAGQTPPARTYRARCSHGRSGAPKALEKAASAVAAGSVSAPPTAANSNAGRVATPRPRRLKETQRVGFFTPGRKQSCVADSTASAHSSASPAAHGRSGQRSPSTVTNPLRNDKTQDEVFTPPTPSSVYEATSTAFWEMQFQDSHHLGYVGNWNYFSQDTLRAGRD